MVDHLPPELRSANMALILGKNTKPELVVRKVAHRLGYRFRLHDPRLPGKPDLVFPSRKAVIFVHGCFWHQHTCRRASIPKSRPEYWLPKLTRNVERGHKQVDDLRAAGWRVLIVWECEVGDHVLLANTISSFLDVKSPVRHAVRAKDCQNSARS